MTRPGPDKRCRSRILTLYGALVHLRYDDGQYRDDLDNNVFGFIEFSPGVRCKGCRSYAG